MAASTEGKVSKRKGKREREKNKNLFKNKALRMEDNPTKINVKTGSEKCTASKAKKPFVKTGSEKCTASKAKKPFVKNHAKRTFKNYNRNSKHHVSKELRVPTMYKQAARILKDLDEKKASVKNLVFSVRRDIRKIYAIVLQSLKYKNVILKLTRKSRLFQKEKHLNPYLARVLIYDMMFGRKSLTGDSKPVQTVLKHRGDITKALKRIMVESSVKSAEELLDKEAIAVHTVPRYARVNALLTTIDKVIKELEDKSYHQHQYEKEITLDEFYHLVKNLEKGQFMQDINFPDLLVFSHRENLSQTELYKNGHIILEDKTSYLAAKALSPPEGSTVLDGCAAPGIKTAHLAALMNNKGKIFACDINEKRMEMLKDMIKFTGIKCSSVILNDFTCIDPSDEQYSSVEYILVDPSCSGSGMVSRLDCLTDDEHSKSYDRIKKLSAFQTVLLKHTLTFPNLKRIVYSTCSINVEENEGVIKEALSGWEETYKLVNALPDWPTRGKEEYEFGPLCLRAYPDINYTNGFFIAVIERIEGSKRTKKKKTKKSVSLGTGKKPFISNSESCHTEFTAQETESKEVKSYEEKNINDSVKKHKKKKKQNRNVNASIVLVTETDSKCKDEPRKKRVKDDTCVNTEEFISANDSSVLHKTAVSQSRKKISTKRKIHEVESEHHNESNTEVFKKKHKKERKKHKIDR